MEYNLNDLITKINAQFQMPLNWTQTIKETWNHREYPYIESDDIASECGLLTNSFKSVRLRTFNANICNYEHYVYWMTVYVEARFLDGGTNNWNYFKCFLLDSGTWEVILDTNM